MSEDEVFVLLTGGALALVGALALSTSRLHGIFTSGNVGIGLHRLAVLLAVAFAGYVIAFHADPSIRGIYVLFYLVLTYAATKLFGQLVGPAFLGLFVRRDVLVRGNRPIAVVTAAFALATGVLFAGSIWGEADPLSEEEGGWWIPLGFFLLGWGILMVATALFAWRGEPLARRLRREHDMRAARTAAVFILSTTAVVFSGVAGDFWGWTEGLLSLGSIGLMLLAHELLGRLPTSEEPTGPGTIPGRREILEYALYVAITLGCWWLNRFVAEHFTGGSAGA